MARAPNDIGDDTLRVLTAAGIGPATLRSLREHLGSDTAIVAASTDRLAQLPRLGRASALAIRRALDAADPRTERAAMARANARLLILGDDDYPSLLAAAPGAPEALWIRGRLDRDDAFAVAVVGARRASVYGREQAARFAGLLAEAGLTIVSGGAVGIDAAAHRAAMRVNGRTITVLGCGLGHCYPPENAELFETIAGGSGALLSEYPMGWPPRASNFPRRNRIVSALGLGVLVIEAGVRSGALITARIAAEEHGREVMAVPGRVDSAGAAGCLRLIQRGGAALVMSPVDVLQQLDALSAQTRRSIVEAGGPDPCGTEDLVRRALTDQQKAMLEVLSRAARPVGMEELASAAGRAGAEVLVDLTALEIRGLVERGPGGVTVVT